MTLVAALAILATGLAWSADDPAPQTPEPSSADGAVAESPQPPAQSTTLPPPSGPVELEVFRGPKPLRLSTPPYPESQMSVGNEGWVALNFMVSPTGKPYAVSVMDSTGNKVFDQAAIRMIERSTFEPARLGDRAIDSGTMLKVTFAMSTPARGAGEKFVRAYKEFIKAVQDGDQAQADAQLPKLNAMNLYEDAYRNLAQFQYALKWGTEEQQLAALKGAVAGEKSPRYLEKKAFIDVLNRLLLLQINAQDPGGAMGTWERLKAIDPKGSAHWQPTIDQLSQLRTTNAKIRTPGRVDASGHSFSTLFKNRFSVEVTSGRLSDLKLRCEKQYLIFRYQPEIEYKVDGRNSECVLELVGDPGTAFALVQS